MGVLPDKRLPSHRVPASTWRSCQKLSPDKLLQGARAEKPVKACLVVEAALAGFLEQQEVPHESALRLPVSWDRQGWPGSMLAWKRRTWPAFSFCFGRKVGKSDLPAVPRENPQQTWLSKFDYRQHGADRRTFSVSHLSRGLQLAALGESST